MGEAILTNRFIPNTSSTHIGDIILSCRTDLGDDYLLCNGANMNKGNSSNEALEIIRDVSGCNYNEYKGYYETINSSSSSYIYYVFDENSPNIYLLHRKENGILHIIKYNNYMDLSNSNPSKEFDSNISINKSKISNACVFKNFIFISTKDTATDIKYRYTYKLNITTGVLTLIDGCSSFVINKDYIYIAINPGRSSKGSGITLQRSRDGINFVNSFELSGLDNYHIYDHNCYTDKDSDKIFIFVSRNTDIPNSIYRYYMYIINTNTMTVDVNNHLSNLYQFDQYIDSNSGIPICNIIYHNNTHFFNIKCQYYTVICTLNTNNDFIMYQGDNIVEVPTYENRIFYKPFKINNELYIRKNDQIYKYDNTLSKFVSLLTTKDKFDKRISNIYVYGISDKPELIETPDGYIDVLNHKWYFCSKTDICSMLPTIDPVDTAHSYMKVK